MHPVLSSQSQSPSGPSGAPRALSTTCPSRVLDRTTQHGNSGMPKYGPEPRYLAFIWKPDNRKNRNRKGCGKSPSTRQVFQESMSTLSMRCRRRAGSGSCRHGGVGGLTEEPSAPRSKQASRWASGSRAGDQRTATAIGGVEAALVWRRPRGQSSREASAAQLTTSVERQTGDMKAWAAASGGQAGRSAFICVRFCCDCDAKVPGSQGSGDKPQALAASVASMWVRRQHHSGWIHCKPHDPTSPNGQMGTTAEG